MFRKRSFRLWLALALLVVSLALILLATWPLPHTRLEVLLPTVQAVVGP